MEGICNYKQNVSTDKGKLVIMKKITLVSSINDNNSNMKVIYEIINNSFNSTNNSDKSINNNDNDNENITYCNITYCNITIIILVSRNLTF